MAKISYDGQSFSLDGRRIWLVSGAIHYPRVPRELWRSRIRAAKQAGLNCIETYGFWNAHEPEPGKLDFTGDLDVRRFVEIVAEEGMFCIFRPGPYICAEWDNGGLPAWLHRLKPDRRSGPLKLREGNGPFLSAASRYITAITEQIKDLQITSPVGSGRPPLTPTINHAGKAAGGFAGQGDGPIVMVQVENEWVCHNPEQDPLYHQQLIRQLREAGVTVPLIACNQLWQDVDGTIHTWNASQNLPADLRQLAAVQPEAPRMVSEYWPGWFDHWGHPHANSVDADKQLYRLAGILAAGAQYNLFMFHGGTNFGFFGGRTVDHPSVFMTTSYDYDAPLLEGGGRAEKYDVTKRISTFASQFASVFAHLDPKTHPAAIGLDETHHPPSVIHLSGQRGDAVFVFKGAKDKTKNTSLLLPNGLTLPVPLGDQRVAWLLLNARLGKVGLLDYTNLSPLAFVQDQMLVVFGPAGSDGMVSIDGAHLDVRVPTGKTPLVEHINGLTLLVLNTAMADAAYPTPDGWVVGSAGLDDQDQPLPRKGWPTRVHVALDGTVTKAKQSAARKPAAPKFTAWEQAGVTEYLDGNAPSYQPLDGPMSFDKLGNDFGYGWYHIKLPKSSRSTATKTLSPGSGDRLHVYQDGKFKQLVGLAPGANDNAPASLNMAGATTLLVDNLGRFNYGQHLGEQKGVLSHFYAVKPIKLPKPKVTSQLSPDPFELGGYMHEMRRGDVQPAPAWSWTVKPAGKHPMVLDLHSLPASAVLKVNGVPLSFYHERASAGFDRFLLDPADDGPFTSGQNQLEIAFTDTPPADAAPGKHVQLFQTTANLTAKAKWSFSPWTLPEPNEFSAVNTKSKTAKPADAPTWFRTTFSITSTRCPLFLHPKAMSKGQLYLNGRNVGRYFMQTRDKQTVPPQSLYYLPEAWLNIDGDNTLTLFDEHGFSPAQCELVYRENGPYG